MQKYVIVWNDESTSGAAGVTGPYEHRSAAIYAIRDYIDDVFSADGPDIWDDVEWEGGWKIEVRLGLILFAEVLSLDTAAFS